MTENNNRHNQELIAQLQNINNSENAEKRDELIEEFKINYPDNLEWLDFFNENHIDAPEKSVSKIPEISGFDVTHDQPRPRR